MQLKCLKSRNWIKKGFVFEWMMWMMEIWCEWRAAFIFTVTFTGRLDCAHRESATGLVPVIVSTWRTVAVLCTDSPTESKNKGALSLWLLVNVTWLTDCCTPTFRQEEWPAGPGSFTAARFFTPGEELHQRHVWLPGPRTFYHPLRHPEELPISPWGQLLCGSWPCRAGWPKMAWSWFWVALFRSVGLPALVEFCEGTRRESDLSNQRLKSGTRVSWFDLCCCWFGFIFRISVMVSGLCVLVS